MDVRVFRRIISLTMIIPVKNIHGMNRYEDAGMLSPPIPAALVQGKSSGTVCAERTPNMIIRTEQTGQLRFA